MIEGVLPLYAGGYGVSAVVVALVNGGEGA